MNKYMSRKKYILIIITVIIMISMYSHYAYASNNLTQNINQTNITTTQEERNITKTTGIEENTPVVQNNIIKEATYDFFINSGKVDVEIDYTLYQRDRLKLSLDLPDDSYDIKSFVDNLNSSISFIDKDQKRISVNRMLNNFKLNYVSKSMLKGNLFIISVKLPYNCSKFIIRVKLSPEYVLYSPIKHEDFGTASIYPKPERIESDGQSLVFIWDYNNTRTDSSFPIVLLVKRRINTLYIILSSLILITAVIFFVKRKPIIKKIIVRKVDKISPHLKEDEEQIIKILKQREGHCEQGTLRIITEMSKAKLSRILKELEERRLIKKVKKGKKNVIFKI